MDIKVDFTDLLIRIDRLTLRAFNDNDLEDFYEYAKTPGLGEMAGWPHHESIDDTREVLERFKKNKDVLAIEKDGKVIGSIGLHPVDAEFYKDFEDKKGKEIGFVLSEAFQRQKIMTEAVKALMKYAFEELDLDYISAGYFRNNFKSRSFQKKLGFTYYGSHIVKIPLGIVAPVHQTIFTKEDYQNNKTGHVEEKKNPKASQELVLKSDSEIIKRLYFEKENEFVPKNSDNPYYIIVIEGRIRVISENKEYTYFPADALRISKGQDFKIISRSDAKVVLIEMTGKNE
ncbi:GNAT family N-acetyltransferase [Anaerococcus murdochii]|uniref:GNAT family N-acetyltransferase n=1 Tax=Anaerococcus murdochii TaxID=411577 RepID=A0ABS7T082_9FIRM|nr:GNAT family N-acetyltransferase [Anaerococcus murdochii]MBZ2387181.1 GNAT family N-acetyltransferase [Anaerococcus murdochii]